MINYLKKFKKQSLILIITVFVCVVLINLFFIIQNNIFRVFAKPGNSILLEEKTLDDGFLEVSVAANEIDEEILGTAFNLLFDDEKLKYDSYSYGDFFEQSGEPIYMCLEKEDFEGVMVCGITLKRQQKLVKGSGNIITFYFYVLSPDWNDFNFENVHVTTLKNGERYDIENIEFRS